MGVLMEFIHAQPVLSSLLVTVLSFALLYLWNRKRAAERVHNPLHAPEVPGKLPIMGHAIAFGKDPKGFLDYWSSKYPKAFQMDLVGRKFVVLSQEYAKAVYKAPDEMLSFDEAVRQALALDLTLGTSVIDFPIHIQVLKGKFTPHLRLFSSAIIREVKELFAKKLRNTQPDRSVAPLTKDSALITNPKLLAMEIISRNSSRSFFGPEVYDNPELLESFITFHEAIDEISKANMLLPYFVARMKSYKVRRHYQLWEDLLYPVIEQRRAEMEAAKTTGKPHHNVDYLQYMLESTNSDGTPLDKSIIVNRMGAIIFASMATTSIALHNLMCHLATNPQVCEKICDEQKEVMKLMSIPDPERERDEEVDADPTYSKAALEKMKYLDATVRESLRLSAGLFASVRMALQDVQLGDDLIIPKGTYTNFYAVTIHENEKNYPNTHEFRPERFLGKGVLGTDFLVFGSGKHACPGRFFAFHELKIATAYMIRNFELSMKDNKTPKLEYVGPNVTTENIPMVLKQRAAPLEEPVFKTAD
eukprot:TRINITY_DN5788_c0_g1_i1.p1 TRINITY_DN5788_c0_g1~~TRINITY_DN5788_c0_g1_i1.p1  ORF type:complete len:531 (+),score=115.24 TRINITY_DN5788_c0_g1_i1:97-1689(+)